MIKYPARSPRASAPLSRSGFSAQHSEDRHRPLNTQASQHTGPQHSEDRHRTQQLSTQLNTQAAALNTAALNSEDRHRPLHTQAAALNTAALKLDLNDFNMCLSMSPITGLSTHRQRLSNWIEAILTCVYLCRLLQASLHTGSGSQHSDSQL